MNKDILLDLQNLSFRYATDKRPILRGVNFQVPRGKITLLLGPSGCGKSTVAFILTGLIPHALEGDLKGSVFFRGENICGRKPQELSTKIGMVFQDAESQFCTFSVKDEIAFGLENLKTAPEEMDERITLALQAVHSVQLRDKLLHHLSGGEKQKIAVAAVLALDPQLLILDEPTANLDPAGTIEFFSLLRTLRDQAGKTILIIEHKLDHLMEIIDQVVLLSNQGTVIQQGPPRQVMEYAAKTPDLERIWLPQLVQLSRALAERGLILPPFYNEAGALASLSAVHHCFNDVAVTDAGTVSRNRGKHIIKAENLSFAYASGKEALQQLNFFLDAGDFLALVGPNGAGKSTLAKLMLGLLPRYGGSLCVDGRELKHLRQKELVNRIGLVFQNPEHQFVANTVFDELAYTLKVRKYEQSEIKENVERYMEKFSLETVARKNPYLLSQGEKRRLSTASMLIGGQDILILDEPTYGQDQQNTEELMEYMQQINREGVTVIIITHDMNLVASFCERVLVLSAGRIIFNGPVRTLFKNEKVLNIAGLTIPPLAALSMKLGERCGFPYLLHEREYLEALQPGIGAKDAGSLHF